MKMFNLTLVKPELFSAVSKGHPLRPRALGFDRLLPPQ